MMSRKNKLAAAVVLSASLGSGGAYAALYGFGPAELWTGTQIISLTTRVATSIATFGTTFGAQMQLSFERAISAVAVATKQEAVSANAISDTMRQSSEQLVNAIKAQRLSDQAATAYMRYNPASGQGYDPCGTTAKNRTMDMAFDAAGAFARRTVASTDVAPGRTVPSVERAMQARLSDHRRKFCTQTEADAGICTLSELPGGDTNAALLFESAPVGSLTSDARTAYMQHVLGAPDQRLPQAAGATPAGEAYMLAKNRKDAMLSIPAYSLAMIDAANTQTPELGGKSPNDVLKIRVNQYFGGAEAEEWSGSMGRQTKRGLMVESAKIAGLEVWLRHQRYEQNQRLEANLAVLVLASAERVSNPLEEQYQKVLSDTVKVNVK